MFREMSMVNYTYGSTKLFFSQCQLNVTYKHIEINLMDAFSCLKNGISSYRSVFSTFINVYNKFHSLSKIEDSDLYKSCQTSNKIKNKIKCNLDWLEWESNILYALEHIVNDLTYSSIVEYTKIRPIGTIINEIKIDYTNLYLILKFAIKNEIKNIISLLKNHEDVKLLYYIIAHNEIKLQLLNHGCFFTGYSVLQYDNVNNININNIVKYKCSERLWLIDQIIKTMTNNTDIYLMMKNLLILFMG
jgi:hypothetical protein